MYIFLVDFESIVSKNVTLENFCFLKSVEVSIENYFFSAGKTIDQGFKMQRKFLVYGDAG